ncbi:MAG: hypothetical protein ABIT47_00850 [Candidatus Paceibacterota bacterium]
MIKISFVRISPTHHRFSYERENGSGESIELETKTYLLHDFVHFCVESEAQLTGGFYGQLAQGSTFADLVGTPNSELSGMGLDVERVVGALTGVVQGRITPDALLDGLKNLYQAYGKPIPGWVNQEYIAQVSERYRKLNGQWNSLRFGERLDLVFGK